MKLEIDTSKLVAGVIMAAIIGGFTWIWKINERVARIESPESMMSRVETLEKLIFPISVEYEVRKRVAEELNAVNDGSDGSEHHNNAIGGITLPLETNENQPLEIDPEVKRAAEDNVRSMIEQRPIEEARNRRGKPIQFKKSKD